MPPKRVTCGPEPTKTKEPSVLASTNQSLTSFNDTSALKAAELNKKKIADHMEMMRLIRKRLNKRSCVMFWDCQPLVMQSQNLKFKQIICRMLRLKNLNG